MKFKPLGRTGVQVSELCFGTMSFGGDADEATSATLYRACREAGINFFDTADQYSQGRSEEILGRLMKGQRDDLVVHDELIHASCHQGMRAGKAATASAKHNDAQAFEDAIRQWRAAGHTGRPWLAAYWLFPYPNTMGLWPQFRSPLIWDVFAVSTYGTVSAMFWFVGLIPDLATLRDSAESKLAQRIFGMLSLGWRGSARHWHRYETIYLLLAGLSTPLVLSVHTVVSFDFAVSNLPGWHATIFPPYFVAGAIYSGFAMVMTLAIPMRAAFNLDGFITMRHIHNMTKIMLVTGMIVSYGYANEAFFSWYSGNDYEMFMMANRMTGPYGFFYWTLIAINAVMIQLFWFRKVRDNITLLFFLSLLVNVGMWLERFVIIVLSLHRDFLPSSWGMFRPTFWDWSTYIGTIGLFMTLFFLFLRLLPAISIFEMRTITPEAKLEEHHG